METKGVKLDPEEVVRYLQEHPQFFDEHAGILAEIRIPCRHDGRTILISERQVAVLRDKNHILQDRLAELIRFGEENDTLGQKLHRLAIMLLGCTCLGDLLQRLDSHLRGEFLIPHVTLRLWDIVADPAPPELAPVSPSARTLAEDLLQPRCGHHVPDEIRNWFGTGAGHLRSFATIPLRRQRTFGLLVLGSEDPQRFYPEMGTLYLTRLGELVSAASVRYRPSTGNGGTEA
jgi:uncharacterized protein YigA (DUF484 family)